MLPGQKIQILVLIFTFILCFELFKKKKFPVKLSFNLLLDVPTSLIWPA